MTDSSKKDCSTCRYVGTYKRPRIMDSTGIDDQLMFEDADKDETVYMCKAFVGSVALVLGDKEDQRAMEREGIDPIIRTKFAAPIPMCLHAGTERLVPITCDAWTAPAGDTARLAELDRMIAARDARNAARTSTDAKK